jgi:hypothetical protein
MGGESRWELGLCGFKGPERKRGHPHQEGRKAEEEIEAQWRQAEEGRGSRWG